MESVIQLCQEQDGEPRTNGEEDGAADTGRDNPIPLLQPRGIGMIHEAHYYQPLNRDNDARKDQSDFCLH